MKHAYLLLALAAPSLTTQAAELTLSGQAVYHNDKIVIDFQAAADTAVSLWTDSWQSGLNFDPQLFLSQGGAIVATDNDGGSLVNTGAGFYDAGLRFTAAAAGSYRLVLNTSSNDALGATLAQGFAYDVDAPIRLVDWNQPGYDVNANDQKGGFWRVHLIGVETAAVVPEPARWALMLPGLLGLSLLARRRR
ncbi:MAG TPA: DVUA0089 family protein [Roseateles sp.]|nr:DVUA0089 family protein [Roseateles sp.]